MIEENVVWSFSLIAWFSDLKLSWIMWIPELKKCQWERIVEVQEMLNSTFRL